MSFPGWLDDSQRAAALSNAAVLAVPSVWPEPFGLVGLEAAAMGVPAVAFDTGGIRQWLRHGVSGLLVPPAGGFRAMAGALVTILDNQALRDRLSRGAIATATSMSLDAHADALERVLVNASQPQIPATAAFAGQIMKTRWHIVTPELPPDCGGVGDYTVQIADALARRGDTVSLYVPRAATPRRAQDGTEVITLDGRFGARARRQLSARLDGDRHGRLLVQYVPAVFGRRGTNLAFCRWLLARRDAGTDVRIMFHEPYFYLRWRPDHIVTAFTQRAMAAILLDASRHLYLSTDTWRRYLARLAGRDSQCRDTANSFRDPARRCRAGSTSDSNQVDRSRVVSNRALRILWEPHRNAATSCLE